MIINECPVCKSHDTSGFKITADEGVCWQNVKCNACASTWDEVYTLSSIESLVDNSVETGLLKLYTVTIPDDYSVEACTDAVSREDALQQVMNGDCDNIILTRRTATAGSTTGDPWKVELGDDCPGGVAVGFEWD